MIVELLGTGTSQGVPVIACNCEVCTSNDPKDNRLRCAVWIKTKDSSIVIDAGPDFRMQMLRAGVQRLDALLITHEHNDHVIGMDDVRPFNFKQKIDMPVYAVPEVQSQLRKRFDYAFAENKYPGVPRLSLRTLDPKSTLRLNEIEFIPIQVMHGNMPVLGFRFGDFTYITDANHIEEEERRKIRGTKTLVINALHHEEHYSHFNLRQALAVIEDINPEKAYLTHISHKMGTTKSINQELPSNVELGYDGLKIAFSLK